MSRNECVACAGGGHKACLDVHQLATAALVQKVQQQLQNPPQQQPDLQASCKMPQTLPGLHLHRSCVQAFCGSPSSARSASQPLASPASHGPEAQGKKPPFEGRDTPAHHQRSHQSKALYVYYITLHSKKQRPHDHEACCAVIRVGALQQFGPSRQLNPIMNILRRRCGSCVSNGTAKSACQQGQQHLGVLGVGAGAEPLCALSPMCLTTPRDVCLPVLVLSRCAQSFPLVFDDAKGCLHAPAPRRATPAARTRAWVARH
jgi:hypothetical protein